MTPAWLSFLRTWDAFRSELTSGIHVERLKSTLAKVIWACTCVEGKRASLDESLTNIQWLCKLESSEILTAVQSKTAKQKAQDPDVNKATNPKPPYSYATLIVMAINSSESKRMTLQDIYQWIETNYPFYQTCKKAWKNSIRHNLSLYDFFIKEKRPPNMRGKGSYWCISDQGKENMMKEVLKHQQPVVNSLQYVQGHSRGLRPILPKPSDASPGFTNTNDEQVVREGSVSGLPQGLPVVVLPTHIYISMANNLAAQASTGDCSAVGIRMQQCIPQVDQISTCGELQPAASFGSEQDETRINGDDPLSHIKTPCLKTSHDNADSLQSVLGEFAVPTVVLPESLKDQVLSSPKLSMSGFDSGIECSPTFSGDCSSLKDTEESAQENQKGENFEEPIPKKTKQEQKTSAGHDSDGHQATLLTGNYTRMTPNRSPLRDYSRRTLATINSSCNVMLSPSNTIKTPITNLFANDTSPLPATPTRNPLNLSSGFLSPSTSAALGCNYPQTFTPLKFDFDSGVFTPFADGGFDSGFLISPSRYPPLLTPDKWCSTPQRCRKTLRLGVTREEEQGNNCLGL